ncbi:MAG: hypothetical protein Kow0092_05590 [Deferrisomatales bacterium]
MTAPPFDRVVVDRPVRETRFAGQLLSRLPGSVPVELRGEGAPRPRGRRTLFVTREPGAFLKPCPCSPGMVSCGYWVLSPVFQCPYACTYCFLRFYAPDEPLTVYANLEDAAREFHRALEGWAGPVRLGTGEFADSLALDPWTHHSLWLRELVAARPRVLLELKTKSTHVELLLDRPALPNLVIAWSVNAVRWAAAEEAGAAPLEARLEAAAEAARAGYRVAFHFDPVVLEQGWEEAYGDVVGRLFAAVPPERVAWVSLGTLRFPPRFLERWGRALKGKRAFFREFVPGADGKLRYFWPLRREAYRYLAARLRREGGAGLPVYLCMEPRSMWAAALGRAPEEGEVAETLCAGMGAAGAPQGAGAAAAPGAGGAASS